MANIIVRNDQFLENETLTYNRQNAEKLVVDDTVYATKIKPLVTFSSPTSKNINSYISTIQIVEASGIEFDMKGVVEPFCQKVENEVIGFVENPRGERFLLGTEALIYLMKKDSELYISDEGIVFFVVGNQMVVTIDGLLWEIWVFDELDGNIKIHIEDEEICMSVNEKSYELIFEIDFLEEHPVSPIVFEA